MSLSTHADSSSQADDALLRLAHALRQAGYRFVTVTPATHQRVNARSQNAWATDAAGVFGWSRRFHPAILPGGMFDLMRAAGIALRDGDGWRSALRLSSLGDDLYWHSAYPTDADDAVFFGPDTYRFAAAIGRHLASRRQPALRVADIGCGAGPGAILAARACPRAEVLALDINADAVRLARINARLAGTANLTAHRSDLLDQASGDFDLVIANPPYLADAAERAYRDGGGPLGMDLPLAMVAAALDRLRPGGDLLMYTGVAIVGGTDHFRQSAQALLAGRATWHYEEVDPDVFGEELERAPYADTERIAAVVLRATLSDDDPALPDRGPDH